MADILNKRNKVHHLDANTDEDMFPIFEKDVDGTSRNNKRLLPRRNYCTISPHDPDDNEGAELETSAAQQSTFTKMRKGTFGRSSGKGPAPAGDNFGQVDGAGASRVAVDPNELMRDGLQVTICVEINQKDKEGATMPYKFAVPALVTDENGK